MEKLSVKRSMSESKKIKLLLKSIKINPKDQPQQVSRLQHNQYITKSLFQALYLIISTQSTQEKTLDLTSNTINKNCQI